MLSKKFLKSSAFILTLKEEAAYIDKSRKKCFVAECSRLSMSVKNEVDLRLELWWCRYLKV